MFVRELRVTYKSRPDLLAVRDEQILSRPSQTAAYLIPILQKEPVEVFVVVCLSAKHGDVPLAVEI